MEATSTSKLRFLCTFLFLLLLQKTQCGEVTYDRKAIIINGQRRIIFSGSIHYPRSTPEMWEDLILKAKLGGLDCVDTYVFWNVHEPSPGQYNFEGRYDLVRFLKLVQSAGLYAHLRIGPYICAEWNFGGFPVWLKNVPRISFRTDNEPFKVAMQSFTQKIVQMMKDEKLFQSQGGPIILSQIENEYDSEIKAFGAAGYAYMTWAANMAVQLDTGVPWVMAKGEDAPDPVINTCNGFYCDYFSPNKPYKPILWTEAWTGWFSAFGGPTYERPVEDLAFAVARFIRKGGAYVNYYMYQGGTNFGRTAGGPFVTTSYDYGAPIDEYGIIRQPKFGHLKDLHKAIKLCEPALVSADPNVIPLGHYREAHVFSSSPGICAAFLANYHSKSAAMVTFNNMHYYLPPWSISILPDCRNAIFNTAQVGVQTSQMLMVPTGAPLHSWETFSEDISSVGEHSSIVVAGLLDQVSITGDISDYLWYTTSVYISPSESFLHGGQLPILTVLSRGDALHVFVNGYHSGSAFGSPQFRKFTFEGPVGLHAGENKISLLSVAMGLPNIGRHFELYSKGVLGPVTLSGLDQGDMDLSLQKWSYQVGLKGEFLNLTSPNEISTARWVKASSTAQNQEPLTWHKAYFDAPKGSGPLALDMSSMGKGQMWINGLSIGRYWTVNAKGNCSECLYKGTYRPSKCQLGCGQPTQKLYHVPRSWLNPSQNQLVVFEELGGDASRMSLLRRMVGSVCADIHEYHHDVMDLHTKNLRRRKMLKKPKVHLQCANGQSISNIRFASFGNPTGTCGNFKQGNCHAPTSYDIIKERCIGKQICSVTVSDHLFGGNPCPGISKKLSVEAVCAPASAMQRQQDSRYGRKLRRSNSTVTMGRDE